MLKKHGVRLGLFLVLVGFAALLTAFGLWRFGSWIGLFLVYSWILNNLTGYGMNTHVATILAIFLGLGVWAGAIYLWKRNRKYGLVIVAALMVLQSVFLLYLEKDRYFSAKSGEPIKYYTISPLTREIQVFDHEVYDVFGQEARPVTFSIAEEIARQKHRGEFPNEEVQSKQIKNFFDPRTGEALAYYYQDSQKGIHLFLRSGFDNRSGQRLEPITQEVVDRILTRDAISQQEAASLHQPFRIGIRFSVTDGSVINRSQTVNAIFDRGLPAGVHLFFILFANGQWWPQKEVALNMIKDSKAVFSFESERIKQGPCVLSVVVNDNDGQQLGFGQLSLILENN